MRFQSGIRRWCSTRVDSSTGIHVSGQGEYGFCNSECPNHETSKFPNHILYLNYLIEVIFHKKSFIFSRPNKSTSDNNTTIAYYIYMPNYFWQSKTKSTMCISIPVPRCDILRWVVWIFWNQILFARTIKIDWNIFFEIRLSKYALSNWN